MALSGNLGFVPLDEVLRLLTRADQQGSLDVWGQDVRGRIFVNRKGISLATTSDDKELRRHLVNSGYVEESYLDSVDAGSATLGALAEKEGSIIDLLREMTVESLYQLAHKGSSFEVTESATSPYASPRAFELEAVLEESRRRAAEWAEVQQVVSDLDSVIRLNRDLGEQDSVKIGRDAWRLLCEMGAGASVRTMAERLGTTDFWTARVAAGLSEQHLLVFAESIAEEVEEVPAYEATVEEAWVAPVTAEPESEVESPAVEDEERSPNESWWVEPQAEESDEAEEVAEQEEPVAEAEQSEQVPSRFGQFAAKVESDEDSRPELGYQSTAFAEPAETPSEPAAYESGQPLETVEEDTEAFLEKVFSQLETNGQPEEEGHGLLRRRRLGSVLKEMTEES